MNNGIAVCPHGCRFFSRRNMCPDCRLAASPAPTPNADETGASA